jgi:hypothetical protein
MILASHGTRLTSNHAHANDSGQTTKANAANGTPTRRSRSMANRRAPSVQARSRGLRE